MKQKISKKGLHQCVKLKDFVGVIVIVTGGKQSQILLCRLCTKSYFKGFEQKSYFVGLTQNPTS